MNSEFKNQTVLVAGSKISGIGAAVLLEKCGAKPVLFDENDTIDEKSIKSQLPEHSEILVEIPFMSEHTKNEASLVVMSPGIPYDAPFTTAFRNRQVPVIGEIELAYRVAKGMLLAITGTNGKTTTTALTGRIMQEYFKSVFVVGNIGNAYTQEALRTNEDSVTVAEISSFQLETIDRFHPHIAAILNITPDHLNRHHTMDNYVAVKESITKNQTENDFCVLNYEDPYLREFADKCPSRVIWFSSKQKLENGFYLQQDDIIWSDHKKETPLMNIHEMKLLGTHNVENVMAAIAMAVAAQVPMNCILDAVKNFEAVEHRIEFVAAKRGVDYYNDSKGTNPDAAIRGIRAMNRKTILIGGGYDKESTYDEWIEAFDGKVKLLVLIGQTADKIAACAKKHGFHEIYMAQSLEEAMEVCVKEAKPGEAVLLSPACASWGMFPNYEVRGKIFKELVRNIKE